MIIESAIEHHLSSAFIRDPLMRELTILWEMGVVLGKDNVDNMLFAVEIIVYQHVSGSPCTENPEFFARSKYSALCVMVLSKPAQVLWTIFLMIVINWKRTDKWQIKTFAKNKGCMKCFFFGVDIRYSLKTSLNRYQLIKSCSSGSNYLPNIMNFT